MTDNVTGVEYEVGSNFTLTFSGLMRANPLPHFMVWAPGAFNLFNKATDLPHLFLDEKVYIGEAPTDAGNSQQS